MTTVQNEQVTKLSQLSPFFSWLYFHVGRSEAHIRRCGDGIMDIRIADIVAKRMALIDEENRMILGMQRPDMICISDVLWTNFRPAQNKSGERFLQLRADPMCLINSRPDVNMPTLLLAVPLYGQAGNLPGLRACRRMEVREIQVDQRGNVTAVDYGPPRLVIPRMT